jgi:hypothetical protein
MGKVVADIYVSVYGKYHKGVQHLYITEYLKQPRLIMTLTVVQRYVLTFRTGGAPNQKSKPSVV